LAQSSIIASTSRSRWLGFGELPDTLSLDFVGLLRGVSFV
jgi:hypothetical protein